VIFYQNMSNLYNQYKSVERKNSQKNPEYDGHHSAVVLILKAALIQVSDYRLLGASGLHFRIFLTDDCVPKSKEYFRIRILS
jgi:hypothetical protein